MISRLVIAGFAAVWAAGCGSPEEARDPALIASIDRVLTDAVENSHYPGLSISIIKNGETLYEAGHGRAVLEHNILADSETIYAVGSVTKPFTCLAIAQLTSQGAVSPDATVGEYLPGYQGPGRSVTVSQLLTHTSGLFDYVRTEVFATMPVADYSSDDVLASFQELPLTFEPGSQFGYSNSGTYLLGLIIEAVSGKTYADYIQTEIIEPMELTRTSIYDRARVIDGRAFGYSYRNDRFQRAPDLSSVLPFSAGALMSSAPDMARFLKLLLRDEVLAPISREQIIRLVPLNDGAPAFYAEGCLLVTEFEGREKISHAGSISGGSAQMAYYPQDDLIIAIGANASGLHPHPWSLERRIARIVLGLEPPAVADKPLTAEKARQYEGDFDLTPYSFGPGRYGFEYRDDGLHLIYGGRNSARSAVRLIHLGGDRFAVPYDSEISFRFYGGEGPFSSVDIVYFDAPLTGRRSEASY